MLPNNRKLREENRPISSFFEGTCAVTLDFPPGHGVQYQSMGFVLLAEIISRKTGQPCAEFVRNEIFAPLGMTDSALGAPDDWFDGPAARRERIVEVRLPKEQEGGDGWNWNSRYWQQVGAPWGGMLSSANDVARFCLSMTDRGGPFSLATQSAALSNQLISFPDVPEADRRCRPWGLGWRLNWLSHSANFGDLLGPGVAGHWGATGTLCWIDAVTGIVCVILSSQPLDRGRNHLVRLSNAVVAAFR
jgi:CubicO group peptidase (beta-lactamase class C family)